MPRVVLWRPDGSVGVIHRYGQIREAGVATCAGRLSEPFDEEVPEILGRTLHGERGAVVLTEMCHADRLEAQAVAVV